MTFLHSSDCQNERPVRPIAAVFSIRAREVCDLGLSAGDAVVKLGEAMIDGHLERMQPIAAELSDIAMRLSDTAKALEQQIAKHRRRNPLAGVRRA